MQELSVLTKDNKVTKAIKAMDDLVSRTGLKQGKSLLKPILCHLSR
jgi:hypothetical protein